jgi:hypothetical protein
VLLPLVFLAAIIGTVTVLQLDGTIRTFLGQQTMVGMIVIVVVLNIVGFGIICMLLNVWHLIRHDLHRSEDS